MTCMERLDDALTQFWLWRSLCAGTYVRMQGHWHSCAVIMVLADGSRILRRSDQGGGSFHETFNGIEKLEEH